LRVRESSALDGTGARWELLAGRFAVALHAGPQAPRRTGRALGKPRRDFLLSAGTLAPGSSCFGCEREETPMAAGRSTAELERFLAERADHLLRTAVLLAGNREAGEDLLQTAVERLLRRWGRIDGDPEGYVRRTLCNLAIDGYRRAGRWRQKERLLRTELRQPQDATGDVDLRDALVRLLLQLPARQRAVLVLRYWEQLTDAEAAAVLGCSEGTVKSSGSRGLARLRELADGWNDTAAMCGRNGKRS
jgi:RNA polymerase sigma-70 factor (sigma-E family)